MRTVYLDHQAATPLLPEVRRAMEPFLADEFGNPASSHQAGLRARDALATARAGVATWLNAPAPEDVIFTSDATEALNLAIKGTAWANERRGRHLVMSVAEQPAVQRSVEFLEARGWSCTRVPVDGEGFIDPGEVAAAIRDDTVLVAVHHANHEIGSVQPVVALGAVCEQRGVALLVDAEASAGWLPVDVQAMRASLLVCSPHRFHGPRGAGILFRGRGARLTPLVHGGAQEGGRRAGVENLPAIVGAAEAALLAGRDLAARRGRLGGLLQRLWSGLHSAVPQVRLNGPPPGERRSPVNLNVSVEFVEGEGLVLLSDLHGLAVASSSSCLAKTVTVSPVLAAIGLDPGLAQGSLLLTLGDGTTEADVDRALGILPGQVIGRLRSMSPLWDDFRQGRVASRIGA